MSTKHPTADKLSDNEEGGMNEKRTSDEMAYTVHECECLGELIDAVNLAIKDGWRPLGGIAVAVSNTSDMREGGTYSFWCFSQAMVKP